MKHQAKHLSKGTAKGKTIHYDHDRDDMDFKDKIVVLENLEIGLHILRLKHAKAIITAEGGITSHAAVIIREVNMPCLRLPQAKNFIAEDIEIEIYESGEIEIFEAQIAEDR